MTQRFYSFCDRLANTQVAKEMEVQAQIKLKLHNVAGQIAVVTRRLQSSQKKKKLEMKTLEGLIQREDPVTKAVSSIVVLHFTLVYTENYSFLEVRRFGQRGECHELFPFKMSN